MCPPHFFRWWALRRNLCMVLVMCCSSSRSEINAGQCLVGVARFDACLLLSRTSGTTSANQTSSRSHAVFQIVLRKKYTYLKCINYLPILMLLFFFDLSGPVDFMGSFHSSIWQATNVVWTLLALTVKPEWKEPRSTKAY